MTDGYFAHPCIIACSQVQTGKSPVCGTDHVTYSSACDFALKTFCRGKCKEILLYYYTRFALIAFRHANMLLCNQLRTPESILKCYRFLRLSRNSRHFLEPDVSLPFSQQPIGFSYSEPGQSRTHNSHLWPEYPIEYNIRNLA